MMEAYQGKLDYIALCFSADNRSAAEEICELLAKARLRVWTSKRGCDPRKDADAERLAGCTAALILVTADWAADEKSLLQLRKAAEADRQIVMLFLDDTDLSNYEDLSLMLSRSTRMLDYRAESAAECLEDLLSILCIHDCRMADNEEPDTKKIGFLGLFH